MKVNNSLIDMVGTAARILKEWETFPDSEYGTNLSQEEIVKLYADMRAVANVADYVCTLLTDPFVSPFSPYPG